MKKLYLSAVLITAVSTLFAQSPGGVSSNLTMWVKADAGTTATGGLLTSWTYYNDATKSFTTTSSSQPVLTTNAINFHPAIVFSGTEYMDGPTGALAPITAGNDSYAAFIVWSSTINNDYQRMWEQRSTNYTNNDAFAISTWNNGFYGDETGTSPFSYTITRPYTVSTWNISELNLKNVATQDLEIIDDRNFATGGLFINTDPNNVNGPALRNLSDVVNRIGANADNAQPLQGSIAEIIVYNSEVDPGAARNQIFSYLSLKYGIPIGTNLVSSGGSTIWDATANSAYNNDVFGLAIDNTSNLSITQANSRNTGNGDGSGISGTGNVTLSNPAATNDGSFIIVGDNGGSLTESTSGAPATPSGLTIFGRRWRAANTGTLGKVSVSIDYTGLTYAASASGNNPSNFALIVDETGNNDFTTTQPTVYSANSVSGNVVTYTNVTLNSNVVFTFGSSATTLPVTWTSISAGLQENNIRISWGVTNNQQAKLFQVQHSTDGASFTPVGQVANDVNVSAYSYLYTPTTTGTHYFRVLETDLDGRSVYSKIVSVNTNSTISALSLKMIGNPVSTGTASIEVDAPGNADAIVEIWTLAGTRTLSSRQVLYSGTNRIDLPVSNLASGNYILTVRSGSTVLNTQFTKQ